MHIKRDIQLRRPYCIPHSHVHYAVISDKPTQSHVYALQSCVGKLRGKTLRISFTCIDRFAVGLDGLRLNCIQSLVVAVLSAPFMALTETVDVGNLQNCWGPLLFAGVLSMGVAYSLQIVGQKSLEPTTASLIMSLESVFAALGGWWLLGETMTSWELLGCALVFLAVLISQMPVSFLSKSHRPAKSAAKAQPSK